MYQACVPATMGKWAIDMDVVDCRQGTRMYRACVPATVGKWAIDMGPRHVLDQVQDVEKLVLNLVVQSHDM